jgi:hypothetical protein
MHFNAQSAFRHAWLALRECNSAPMITSAEPGQLLLNSRRKPN